MGSQPGARTWDGGGKPKPACKAVLIGLANHAGPDGKDTFPSEKTLVRYTCLSKRTAQAALDRLEAEGITRPCDPAVVAVKIKRAGRRPQGWDLAMGLIRDDLDDEDLAVLERQFPGRTARVMTTRTAGAQVTAGANDGVQPLRETGCGQLHPNRPLNHPPNRPPPATSAPKPFRRVGRTRAAACTRQLSARSSCRRRYSPRSR